MKPENQKLVDLEFRISHFLRYGVFLSALCLGLALIVSLLYPSIPLSTYTEYVPKSFFVRFEEAWMEKHWGHILSYAGLIVLISLPLIRVFLTGFLFFKNKEKAMSCMAFLVFIILLGSFLLGVDL